MAVLLVALSGCTPEEGRQVKPGEDTGFVDSTPREARADAGPTTTKLGSRLIPADGLSGDVDPSFGDHLAHEPIAKPSLRRLFVLLPELHHQPSEYEQLVLAAARGGHHAVALAYPNARGIAEACGADAACFELARLEVLYGKPKTPAVDVGLANCIECRLKSLLLQLDEVAPGQGWSGFVDDKLDSAPPLWNVIVVGGHGEGAAFAAMLARDHELARVSMFSGFAEELAGSPVPWVSTPHATSPSLYFALTHGSDESKEAFTRSASALGVDPTHQVTTSITPLGGGSADAMHGCTALDAFLPLDEKTKVPILDAVWRDILGP